MRPDILWKMKNLGAFVAKARTGVIRDYQKGGIVVTTPIPEGPARVGRQLQTLAGGIAVIHGENHITDECYRLIKKVARDSIHPFRVELLSHLFACPELYTGHDLAGGRL
jgi:hypothetical protein